MNVKEFFELVTSVRDIMATIHMLWHTPDTIVQRN
jgi:hypothetical protein